VEGTSVASKGTSSTWNLSASGKGKKEFPLGEPSFPRKSQKSYVNGAAGRERGQEKLVRYRKHKVGKEVRPIWLKKRLSEPWEILVTSKKPSVVGKKGGCGVKW